MSSDKKKTATKKATGTRIKVGALVSTRGASDLAASKGKSGPRVTVAKAYKMFIGGAFVRSESGRYFQVEDREEGHGADPTTVNIPRGSRKDVRDAVLAAKNAHESWAGRTAFNRGQIVYRLAEVMESRRDELAASLERAGLSAKNAEAEVSAAIDRAVFYSGLCDKVSALVASHNPVAGPHFGFSIPEPMGVIGVIAPNAPALLGLVSTILPAIATGNTCVAVASESDPRTAVVFSECLATSDLPGGVVNIITGQASELAGPLAKHREVNGIDAFVEDAALRATIEREGADSVKRVKTRASLSTAEWFDERGGQGLSWVERFLETKTVWHPMGV